MEFGKIEKRVAEKGRAVQISAFFGAGQKSCEVVDLQLHGDGKKW